MKKNVIILVAGLLVLLIGLFYFFNNQATDQNQEQVVLEQTLTISQKYSILRYRTENVLNIKNYPEYDTWNNEMTEIIQQWKILEDEASILEKSAREMAEEKVTFKLIQDVHAYDSVEVNKVIENAPAGRQIRTLAKHLGVDAKMAQLILNQTQDQITREAYGMEGDVFETCEQNSMRIKNSAKVTVFVGGVVLTGGMSAVAASGVVAKTALVVGGADLVLEVADDEAKIALGDKNKVSEMVGKMRTVTEPAASILTLVNIPGNVSKAMEKISAISFVGDQIRSVAQDEKILGISIKTDDQGEVKAQVSGLTEAELPEWMKENNVVKSGESIEEIIKQIETKEIEKEQVIKTNDNEVKNNTNQYSENEMIGIWKGVMKWTPGAKEAEQSKSIVLEIKADGTVNPIEGSWNSRIWKQEGDLLRFYNEEKGEDKGYHEFVLNGNELIFVKIAGPDQEDPSQWAEVLAGSEFFGGRYMEMTMIK
jgi:hypothetical protein